MAAVATFGLPPGMRACLFDLDGVLTKTAALHAEAWKQLFDDYLRERALATGTPFVAFDAATDYDRYVDGKLRIDGARSFLVSRNLRLPESQVAALAQRKDKFFLGLLKKKRVETYEGSVRYVEAVRTGGLKTAVVTASRHGRQVLGAAELSALFDVRIDGVTAGAEHLAGKPAPDSYLAAARALGVPPSQAAVFEDAIAGVEAGRAGHFGYVVGVDRAGQAGALRQHGADVVVSDLSLLLEHT
jgi:beta-phosphoglucomutase family hydrolase